MKALALTVGLGAVIGAVGILMMSRDNPARKLATQAACKAEDAAYKIGSKLDLT